MRTSKRATVYFDAEIHRDLRLKAAAIDRPISEIINDAARQSLAEDARDLAAFEDRADEKDLDFETVVKDLNLTPEYLNRSVDLITRFRYTLGPCARTAPTQPS